MGKKVDYIDVYGHEDNDVFKWPIVDHGPAKFHGRAGDDILIASANADDFVFKGGKGQDYLELYDIHDGWTINMEVSNHGKHIEIELLNEKGKVEQHADLYNVEVNNLHFHFASEDVVFPF